MPRPLKNRSKKVLFHQRPLVNKWLQQRTVRIAVHSQPTGGLGQRGIQRTGRSIVKRMGCQYFGMNELQTKLAQRQLAKKGRGRPQGMNGRTQVVEVSR